MKHTESVVTRQQRRARERAARKAARRAIAVGALLTAAGTASAATITVNSLADTTVAGDTQCTLREALANANGNSDTTAGDCAAGVAGLDIIGFQSGLTGTITLGGSELPIITDSVTINGPGAAIITISGNTVSRIFEVYNSGSTTPINVDINNLTLTAGQDASYGGAIHVSGENVVLDHMVITANACDNLGGGVDFQGSDGATLTITDSTISNNTATASGGGISIERSDGAVNITNTVLSGNTAQISHAGGILVYAASAPTTITGCTISGNSAPFGGGIEILHATATTSIAGCTISGNAAAIDGGGVFAAVISGNLTIANSTVSGNTAGLTTQGHGGGLDVLYAYASVYLQHDTFGGPNAADANKAGLEGGAVNAVLSDGASLFIQNTKVLNNVAGVKTGYFGDGGGVRVEGPGTAGLSASAAMTNSIISGNIADPQDGTAVNNNAADIGYGGGLYLKGNLSTAVSGTTISGNTAAFGGGVYLYTYAGATFDNSTIANNTAASPATTGSGGGVELNTQNAASFNETTISGNSAQGGAGGIFTYLGSVVLENAIVANSSGAPDVGANTGTITANYTLIEDPGAATIGGGTGNITGTDPSLGALATNNSTILAGAPASEESPQTEMPQCSVVINAGDPAFTPPPSTDERGLPRVSNGRIDMGAVEVQAGTIQLSAATQSVSEGAGSAIVTATRSGGGEGAVAVTYATADGTATAPADYTSAGATLTWADGDTANKTFNVPIVDDAVYEPSETFSASLSAPTCGATLGATATQTVTIVDNDTQPAISIDNVSLAEGNAATTAFVFTVTLSSPSGFPTTVNYATADGTATSAATAPGDPDYSPAAGVLTFPAGTTTQTITVNVNGDTVPESNETFAVDLSGATNATIATASGTGTIVNDDGAPSLSINSVSQAEGSGSSNMTFTVTLAPASGQTVTVNYATADGTANSGSDYTTASGTLTFTPGVTTQTISVPIIGDATCESDETFTVTLSAPANATISTASGTGTIVNDDSCEADVGISMTTAGGPNHYAGQTLTYDITVTNAGPTDAASVVVTDVLPADTSFVSATPSQGSCSGTTTVTCSLGTIANAGSATITLQVTPSTAGPLSNTASVSAAPQPDANASNDAATTTVTIGLATAIPTLSAWAKILLALTTAFLGLFALRTRQ